MDTFIWNDPLMLISRVKMLLKGGERGSNVPPLDYAGERDISDNRPDRVITVRNTNSLRRRRESEMVTTDDEDQVSGEEENDQTSRPLQASMKWEDFFGKAVSLLGQYFMILSFYRNEFCCTEYK